MGPGPRVVLRTEVPPLEPVRHMDWVFVAVVELHMTMLPMDQELRFEWGFRIHSHRQEVLSSTEARPHTLVVAAAAGALQTCQKHTTKSKEAKQGPERDHC